MTEHLARLQKARINLLLDEPFFGSLMMQLKPVEDPKVPRFRTNGTKLWFNPAYLDILCRQFSVSATLMKSMTSFAPKTWPNPSAPTAPILCDPAPLPSSVAAPNSTSLASWHGYIVQTFADGLDECQNIDLGVPDRIRTIIAAVKARELPDTTGFFFRVSDSSE